MTGPVRSTRTERVGALTSGTTQGGTRAGQAMTSLAGRVAGSVARELRLVDDRGSRGSGSAAKDDLYEVAKTARSLNDDLGGRAVDEGLLARSLGAFVEESASLIAARPVTMSLSTIEDAIARVEAARSQAREPETVATALVDIDRTTAQVAGRPGR